MSNSTAVELLSEIERSISLYDLEYAQDRLSGLTQSVDITSEGLSDQVHNIQLQIFIGQGKFDALERYLEEVVPESIPTNVRYLMAKAILANRSQSYKESLIYFLEAESIAKSLGDAQILAQVQINIGTVYAGLHHYREGLDRYSAVLDNYDTFLRSQTQAAILHNLGNLHYAIGDLSQSIKCLEASIAKNSRSLLNRSQLLLQRAILAKGGAVYTEVENIEEGHDLYPIHLYCQSFNEAGDQQLDTLERSRILAKLNNDYKTEMDAAQRIIDIHKATSQWQSAFVGVENLRSAEQRLFQIQQSARLAEQAARYQLAEKEQAIFVLEKEKELKQEIEKRNDMLEAVNEELRQFAYVVSHDLKEPLRMIGAYTQLIELGEKGSDDADRNAYFGFVKGGVSRLNILLDGLSNFSTLKSLQNNHELQSLNKVIETSIENLDVLIRETGTTMSIDTDIKVVGSETLLVLLFQNLIQNAIKFRAENETPQIHIYAQQGDRLTTIEVSDNGIGIPNNQRERIFIIFQRLSRDKSEGSGMGLAICKKIVQLHEGRIYVRDRPEISGTTMCIELPN